MRTRKVTSEAGNIHPYVPIVAVVAIGMVAIVAMLLVFGGNIDIRGQRHTREDTSDVGVHIGSAPEPHRDKLQ